jgi:uncharacterized 2Fe-2S/4Fe-4S cluster protein (DUF4445 family)
LGQEVDVESSETLLDGLMAAGIELVSVCGGRGLCGKCRVRLVEGELLPPDSAERDLLGAEQVAQGYRLACLARLRGDVRVELPTSSLPAAQRLQTEGRGRKVAPQPLVVPLDVDLAPVADGWQGVEQLKAALSRGGIPAPMLSAQVLAGQYDHISHVRCAMRADEVVALLPGQTPLLGLAVDVGTTKLAAYLVNLESGDALAKSSAMNPQVAYGDDVISRISYANEREDGRIVLQEVLFERLNRLVDDLCASGGADRRQIVDAVAVGNTAMHHLMLGLPVRQLGEAPYEPALTAPLAVNAGELGLRLAAGANAYFPPNVAGYVGGDHIAAVLSAEVRQEMADGQIAVMVDIGTNTEISLAAGGRLFSCSCASGPAFEGAHISDGMRAAPGAIEHVQIREGVVYAQTVGGSPPVGICGSGILDGVAEMLCAGIIDHSGRIRAGHRGVIEAESGHEFVLVGATQSGTGRDIRVTRRDVSEVQLAKGAIRAGLEILLREAGIDHGDIDTFIVAGAFGTYIDIESAMLVGMFPQLPVERFRQVGNAAGIGAWQMLISEERRRTAEEIAEQVEYVELTAVTDFADVYVKALPFGEAL